MAAWAAFGSIRSGLSAGPPAPPEWTHLTAFCLLGRLYRQVVFVAAPSITTPARHRRSPAPGFVPARLHADTRRAGMVGTGDPVRRRGAWDRRNRGFLALRAGMRILTLLD